MEKQKPALQVTDLSKAYGSVQALRSVSFAVEPGTVVALLGPNGAGKTTALQCILGIADFRGTVEVDGISVRDRGKEARRRIGYLPQTPALADSVLEYAVARRPGSARYRELRAVAARARVPFVLA